MYVSHSIYNFYLLLMVIYIYTLRYYVLLYIIIYHRMICHNYILYYYINCMLYIAYGFTYVL